MSGVTREQPALVGFLEERQAEVRAELAEVLEKSDEILMWDVNAAWDAIEREASRLVEKAEGLTKEKAVSRVLRTTKGKQLYSNYIAAQDAVRQSLELAEGAAARRGMDEWTRERTVDALSKTADAFGDGAAEDRARELVREDRIARAFGGRARQPVEKGSRAWTEIERRAAALVQKSDAGLSQAQAIDRILQTHEGQRLYTEYMQPVEREWASEAAALAKADGGPALNTGEGVAGPSMSGSADGEPLSTQKTRTARQVLLSLAERLEAAQADGEDVEDALRRELSVPVVRQAVVAAVDALEQDTEKAAASKQELRRRLEGLEAAGRKARRVAKAAPVETVGAWPETWVGH